MECPKCKTGVMEVTHTYNCGERGTMQRLVCNKCDTVGTAQNVLINIDPKRGEGAFAIAKKVNKKKTPER